MEAFNRRDLQAAANTLDEDVEWDFNAALIDEGIIRGRAEVIRYWERVLTTFPFVHEQLQFVDVGEHVCVLADIRAQGVASGLELAGPCGYAMTVRAGAITRVRFYESHAEALKVLGLDG
jgi:ketosteroid isomerase-like protein